MWLYSGERRELAWDRKVCPPSPLDYHASPCSPCSPSTKLIYSIYSYQIEGGFPELKILKQRVRDIISPASSLGHSDKKGKDGGHVNLVV